MSRPAVLSCKGLSKRYGRRSIISDIGFELREGSILGLLGPNGAGKTTIMKGLLGLVYPDEGEVMIFGHDLSYARKKALMKVGAIVEAPVFPGYLTGFENLDYLSSLTSRTTREGILDTLELVGLKDAANLKVEAYSFGMKQRLGIAQALLPDSKILILDEPTNGLDPHGIAGMRRLLKRLSTERGVSIIVSSHLLFEMEQVCDHVVIIHHGRKMLDAGVEELAQKHESIQLTLREPAPQSLHELPGFISDAPSLNDPQVRVLKYGMRPAGAPSLVKAAVEGGAEILSVSHSKLDLECLFLELTAEAKGSDNVRIDSF
jgi:ABC-2 type transport system ATP-binding protein